MFKSKAQRKEKKANKDALKKQINEQNKIISELKETLKDKNTQIEVLKACLQNSEEKNISKGSVENAIEEVAVVAESLDFHANQSTEPLQSFTTSKNGKRTTTFLGQYSNTLPKKNNDYDSNNTFSNEQSNLVKNIKAIDLISRPALGDNAGVGHLYSIHLDQFYSTNFFRDLEIGFNEDFREEDLTPRIYDDSVLSEKLEAHNVEDDFKINYITKLTEHEDLQSTGEKYDGLVTMSLLIIKPIREYYLNTALVRDHLKIVRSALDQLKSATHFVYNVIYGYKISVNITCKMKVIDEISREDCVLLLRNELKSLRNAVFNDDLSQCKKSPYGDEYQVSIKINCQQQKRDSLKSQYELIRELQKLVRANDETYVVPIQFKLCHIDNIDVGLPLAPRKKYKKIDENLAMEIADCAQTLEDRYSYFKNFLDQCRRCFKHIEIEFESKVTKDEAELKRIRKSLLEELQDVIAESRNDLHGADERLKQHLSTFKEKLSPWILATRYQQYAQLKQKFEYIEELKNKKVTIIGRCPEGLYGYKQEFSSCEGVLYECSFKKIYQKDEVELKNARLFDYIIKKSPCKKLFYDLDVNHQNISESSKHHISYYKGAHLCTPDELFELLTKESTADSIYILKDDIEAQTYVTLKLPCPNSFEGRCSKEEKEWKCGKCLQRLSYGMDNYIYCGHCGRAPVNTFRFHCGIWEHGSQDTAYSAVHLDPILKNVNAEKRINLLVIGDTGVGKSTWINSFSNYLNFNSLKEAQMSDLDVKIPVHFTIHDDADYDDDKEEYKEYVVKIGSSSNEGNIEGQSKTQKPKEHSFHHDGLKICFIDTPGVDDSRGEEQDKKNFDYIISFISEYPQINSICILLKADQKRITNSYRYCIRNLLSCLTESAIKNIIFCFTHAKGSSYGPGEALNSLGKYLKVHGFGEKILLSPKRIFNIDNEGFRYLCELKCHNLPTDEWVRIGYEKSWEISKKETERLLDYVKSIPPYLMRDMETFNEARKIICMLVKPLVDICANMQANVNLLKRHHDYIYSLYGLQVQSLQSMMPYVSIKAVPLEIVAEEKGSISLRTATVCPNIGCAQIKYHGSVRYPQFSFCHEACSLQNLTFSAFGHPELEGCTIMSNSGECTKCSNCHWSNHLNVSYDIVRKIEEICNMEIYNAFYNYMGFISKDRVLSYVKQKIEEFTSERNTILTTMAKFDDFLGERCLVKSPYLAFLKQMATLEKVFEVQELGQKQPNVSIYPVIFAEFEKIHIGEHNRLQSIGALKSQKDKVFGLEHAKSFLLSAEKLILEEHKKALALAEEHYHVKNNNL